MDRYTKSKSLFEEAKEYFPGGVNSPVRAFKSVHGTPLFIQHGSGPNITCADGHSYLDFCCSWGPLILGHNHPEVRAHIQETLAHGTSFGAPTQSGNALGKLIIQHHSYIEQIRFVSSGTEAVMSAIRLARGYTGRNKIIKFEGCYHGHVDSLLVKAGSGLATFGESSSAGVPASFIQETIVLPLDDIDLLRSVLQKQAAEIAAVIIEPIPANNGLLIQTAFFLKELRKLCSEYDVLLIFDEVISGFRIGFQGAAGLYDIGPDIITFGKIIGGGLPVGCFAASREIMSQVSPEGPVYQAGTLSANPVAMAAGLATLEQLLKDGFYEDLEVKTRQLSALINSHTSEMSYPIRVRHIGSIFWIAFSLHEISRADQIDPVSMEYFKELHRYLLDHGVYLGPSGYEVGFVSAAHTTEDIEQAAIIINQGIDAIFN